MTDPLVIKVAVGEHDHVKPLKDGRVCSDRLKLDFIEFHPLPKAFRHMVRGGDLDVCEMAVVNQILAHRYEKGLTALAIPLWSRLPHTNLVCPAQSNLQAPGDLEGQKVGVRAYAQTSGVWVRGMLQSEYGVDLDRITWMTMEDAHVPDYADPPGTLRNSSSMGLRQLMMAGELAAIMGEREVDPEGIRAVVPDAEQAALNWIRKTGMFPVNHILAIKKDLLARHAWVASELMNLFERARHISEASGATAPPPYGRERNRRSLQLLLEFAAQQRLTERVYDVDELFQPI